MPDALDRRREQLRTSPQVPIADDPDPLARRRRSLEGAPPEGAPAGAQPTAAPEPTGLGGIPQRAFQRFTGTDVPPGPDPETEISRLGGATLLAGAGAIAGLRTPIAPGPAGVLINPLTGSIAGGALGMTAGTLAPEFSFEIAESLGLVEPGTTERLGRPLQERIRMAQGEAALDAMFGVAGTIPRLFGRSLARVATRPGKKPPSAMAEEARTGRSVETGQELAQKAQRELGITLMPWQVGSSPIARAVMAVAGRFPWVGAPARKTPTVGRPMRFTSGQALSEEQALGALSRLPRQSGGEVRRPFDLSDAIFEDAKDLVHRYRNFFGGRYDALWDAAETNNVGARIDNLHGTGRHIVSDLDARAATEAGTPRIRGARAELKRFIEEDILTLDSVQSLRQLDTILDEISEQFLRAEPAQSRFVLSKINELRSAALRDFTDNVIDLPRAPGPGAGLPTDIRAAPGVEIPPVEPPGGPTLAGVRAPGGGFGAMDAKGIAAKIRELDQEFSTVMSTVFETSTAKKFARVERRGLRGITFDPVTSTPIGKLASITLDMEDPKVVRELFSLMRPKTQRDMVASILDEGMSQSWKEAPEAFGTTGLKFETGAFNDFFGLSPGKGARGDAMKEMLRASGSDLEPETLRLLGKTLDVVADTSLPSASAFIARRAQIGGGRAVIAGMMGGLAGGGAGFSADGFRGAGIGMVLSFLGTRSFVRAISNPSGARALRNAVRDDAGLAVIRANTIRLLRLGFSEQLSKVREQTGDIEQVREIHQIQKDAQEALSQEMQAIERDQKGRRR